MLFLVKSTDKDLSMQLRKYKLLIMITFMSIFVSKMIISGAPVFLSQFDDAFMASVIMQLETESQGDDQSKSNAKYSDHKVVVYKHDFNSINLVLDCGVPNSFIEHSRRYVDPYHPLVPTPPPNFS